MEKNGYFIVVDGCDAAGKGSSIDTIKNFFINKKGIKEEDIVTTREPGGTKYGEKIRKILLSPLEEGEKDLNIDSELLLFFASRSQLIDEVIKPSLDSGKLVISDRWTSSTYTYQKERGANPNHIIQLDNMFCKNIKPDTFMFLDVYPEKTLERIKLKRNNELERTESSDKEYFKRIRDGYVEYINNIDNSIIIDANQDLNKMLKNIEKEMEYIFGDENKRKKKKKDNNYRP